MTANTSQVDYLVEILRKRLSQAIQDKQTGKLIFEVNLNQGGVTSKQTTHTFVER